MLAWIIWATFEKQGAILTILTSDVFSGEQSTSHSAATCCLFATRKMQCHHWKEIQWGKVRTVKSLNITPQLSPLTYARLFSLVFISIFSPLRHPELAAVCRDSRTLILYPGPKSQNLEELVQYQEVGTVNRNVIIIDGTWSQAKNMFLKNSLFHLPKQVRMTVLSHLKRMFSK